MVSLHRVFCVLEFDMGRSLVCLVVFSFLWGCGTASRVQPTQVPSTVKTSTESAVSGEAKPLEVVLVLKEATVYGGPQTEILLKLRGAINELVGLGTIKSSCVKKTARTGEFIRLHCWWAGAGQTIVVKTMERSVLVTKTEIDELGKKEPTHSDQPKRVKILKRVPLQPGQKVSVELSAQ